MRKIAFIAALFSLFAAAFGEVKFGAMQWTKTPSATAQWPTGPDGPLALGNVTAMGLMADGALERYYAGTDTSPTDIPSVVDLSGATNRCLLPKTQMIALLNHADAVFAREDLFASAYCPEIPVYAPCTCGNPASHGPEHSYYLGRCALNLECFGMVFRSYLEDSTTNLFDFAVDRFEFANVWKTDPWDGDWRQVARSVESGCGYVDADPNETISYLHVLNPLATLTAFDRTYGYAEYARDPWNQEEPHDEDDPDCHFDQEAKTYSCERQYYFAANVSFGEVSTEALSDFDELVKESTCTTNLYRRKIARAFSREMGVSEADTFAEVLEDYDVGRPIHMTDDEWERQNPTAGEVRGGYTRLQAESAMTGYSLYRAAFSEVDEWSIVMCGGAFKYTHTSSSSRAIPHARMHLGGLESNQPLVAPAWQGHSSNAVVYAHMRGKSTRREDGNLVRNATNLHATVSGNSLTNLYDAAARAVNEYGNLPDCDMETSGDISVVVDARGIPSKPPPYAAVYNVPDEIPDDETVYPIGIVFYEGDSLHYESDTRYTLTYYPSVSIDAPHESINELSEMQMQGRIIQTDWNFNSIKK